MPEKRADCEGSDGDVRMMLGSSETSQKDLSDDPRHDPKGWRGDEISWDQWGGGAGKKSEIARQKIVLLSVSLIKKIYVMPLGADTPAARSSSSPYLK